jgi:hypothetical protein
MLLVRLPVDVERRVNELVSVFAAAIGRVAAGRVWDANRTRDTLKCFAKEAAQAARLTERVFSELCRCDEWHQIEDGLFSQSEMR